MPEQTRAKGARRGKASPRGGSRNWLYLVGAAAVVVIIGLAVIVTGQGEPGGAPKTDNTGSSQTPVSQTAFPSWLSALKTLGRYTGNQVREAYAYAETAQDNMGYIPCYCGCGDAAHGYHRSSFNCFVKNKAASGDANWEQHGSQCEMCVDIALTTKSMLGQGKTLKQVRAEIDRRYASIGRPTDTPPVP